MVVMKNYMKKAHFISNNCLDPRLREDDKSWQRIPLLRQTQVKFTLTSVEQPHENIPKS